MSRKIDYSSRDYEGFRNDLIEQLKLKIPEYSDFSQSDAGIVLIELLSHGLDVLSYYNDIVANEVFLETARERDNVVKLARFLGYTPREATPSRFKQVFEVMPSDTDTVIPKGLKLSTKSESAMDVPIIFETTETLIIPKGESGLEQEDGEYKYSVEVVQGESIEDEIVGTSNETANQEFYLGYSPVLHDTVELFVQEGSRLVMWERVDNFLHSNSTSRHYTLETDEQELTKISFGSGSAGMIPPEYENGIIASYDIGGGTLGNVSPYTISELVTPLSVVEHTFNPYVASYYGTDVESIHSIKEQAPRVMRTLWRAVTPQDYEELVMLEKTFVKQAKMEKITSDDYRLYVLPTDSFQLTPQQKEDIEEFILERGIISTEEMVTVESPEEKKIDISMEIRIKDDYFRSEIRSDVTQFLETYFSNPKLGEDLYLSKIIGEMIGIDGVLSVRILEPSDDVELVDREVKTLGEVTLSILGGVDDEQ